MLGQNFLLNVIQPQGDIEYIEALVGFGPTHHPRSAIAYCVYNLDNFVAKPVLHRQKMVVGQECSVDFKKPSHLDTGAKPADLPLW